MYRNIEGYEDSVKAHREANFPTHLILQALTTIDVKNASASQPLDKIRILNTICRSKTLEDEPPQTSEFYDEVDSGLRSIFALAALPACAKKSLTKELESIATVLQKDTVDRESLRLGTSSVEFVCFLQALPVCCTYLHLFVFVAPKFSNSCSRLLALAGI